MFLKIDGKKFKISQKAPVAKGLKSEWRSQFYKMRQSHYKKEMPIKQGQNMNKEEFHENKFTHQIII